MTPTADQATEPAVTQEPPVPAEDTGENDNVGEMLPAAVAEELNASGGSGVSVAPELIFCRSQLFA